MIADMRTSEAIEHFGSQAELARALGIKAPSVAEWGEFPPALRQLQIELLTKRALTAEPGVIPQPREQAA